MQVLVITLILLLFSVPLGIAMQRSTELFVLDVRSGALRLKRGRMPHRLFDDLGDVLGACSCSGIVIARVSHGSAILEIPGSFPDSTAQQLRNVVGTYSLASLRSGSLLATARRR